MEPDQAVVEICKILDLVNDDRRYEVLNLAKEIFCFQCGNKYDIENGCQCWDQK